MLIKPFSIDIGNKNRFITAYLSCIDAIASVKAEVWVLLVCKSYCYA